MIHNLPSGFNRGEDIDRLMQESRELATDVARLKRETADLAADSSRIKARVDNLASAIYEDAKHSKNPDASARADILKAVVQDNETVELMRMAKVASDGITENASKLFTHFFNHSKSVDKKLVEIEEALVELKSDQLKNSMGDDQPSDIDKMLDAVDKKIADIEKTFAELKLDQQKNSEALDFTVSALLKGSVPRAMETMDGAFDGTVSSLLKGSVPRAMETMDGARDADKSNDSAFRRALDELNNPSASAEAVGQATIAAVKENDWMMLAEKHKYEGAGVLVNFEDKLLFLVNKKGQAEFPGGKIEAADNGSKHATALRELREETGMVLNATDLYHCFKTEGGTSGFPSYQFVTRRLKWPEFRTHLEGSHFEGATLSKIYFVDNNKWMIKDGPNGKFIPIRKFNTFFIEQNKEGLKSLGFLEDAVST